VLGNVFRCYTQTKPKDWPKLLPWAAYCYNTSFHSTIGMLPYKAIFGRDPPPLLRYEVQARDTPMIQEQLQSRDALLDFLKANIAKAQRRMKTQADSHRRDVEYKVGDFVYVKLQPYRQHSMRLIHNQKLSMRYFGPFQIVARIGPVAYKLQLPPTAQIHPVFHVSVLKKCEGHPQPACVPEPLLLNDNGHPL